MASYCHPREHSGARSIRKRAGQSACRRKCANSFQFEVYGTRLISVAVMLSEAKHLWFVRCRVALRMIRASSLRSE
jgi:hypothetical protein